MAKFKEGDKVRIRKDLTIDEISNTHSYESAIEIINNKKEMIISSVILDDCFVGNSHYYGVGDQWIYYETWFELIVKNEVTIEEEDNV